MSYLLEKINEHSLFQMTKDQLFVGDHGEYTPAIGTSLYYDSGVKRWFIT